MSSPARMTPDWNMTSLHGETFQERLSQTFEGMAHFAGSGPSGARCQGCAFWGDGQGRALNRRCRKFSAMTGVTTKLVPGSALACRHFEKKEI